MRILLVDDDEVFCQALKTNLHKNYYIVDTASDGQEGWELVEAGQYDLIVLDVIMPKLDGISFCHQLRKKGWQILVMLLTARGTSSDKIEGLDAGADDYVVKPIPLPELEARIRALLRRRSNDGSPVLQWGNLILDPNVNKFTYEGIILSLTAKEYSLLELFIRNTEKIHSQSSIINQLWSFEEEPPTGDTVRTLVKRLRRKLKLVGASDLIETVYGLGYRLNHKLSHSEKLSKIADNSKKDNYSEHLGKIVVNKDEKKSGYKFPKKSLINANSLNNADFYREIQSITCKEISRLEEALNNLKRNYSQDNSLEKARQITHKLIGSLGVFNLSEAITIIRELEIFFRDSCAKPGLIESQKYKHIGVQIQRLRSLIADADESQLCKQLSKTYNATQDNTNIRYRLLILDNDKSFVDNLVIRIANQDIQAIAEKDFQSAQDAIARVRPDIVLLDMSFHNNLQDMLDLLEKLSTKQPPVPTLVVSDNETTVNRIAIARRQVKGFWRKPVAPEKILDALKQVLIPQKKIEAKVLLIDDDRINLYLLKTLLEPWGLQVNVLNNPLNFWDELETVMPDILVLDVQMPNIDGVELCQMIRNDQRWSWLPIMFLTGQDDLEIVQKAFAAGADDFVSKPIVAAQVTTRILNRLERHRILREQAEIDILTGLPNRQRASQDFEKLLRLAKQYQQPFCFAVLSLDNLVQINYKYGHRFGDRVLYRLAYLLKQELRDEDIIARWNGAEFVVGMYGMNSGEGVEWLAEILEILRQIKLKTSDAQIVTTSFSAGVVQYPDDGSYIRDLYQSATYILEKAKDDTDNALDGRVLSASWKPSQPFSVEDKYVQSKVDVTLLYENSDFADSIMRALLTRGYSTHWMQDGDSAVSFMGGTSPCLHSQIILLQDSLPEKKGLQLLENFKKNTVTKSSKILWLSNNFTNVEEAMKIGCFDYINLPCKMSTIMYQIRRAWGKR